MIRKGLIFAVLILTSSVLIAQPSNPSGAPVSGAIYLLIAGITFGVVRLSRKKNIN